MTEFRAFIERWLSSHGNNLLELWRYYKIGIINSIFGYACYVTFVYVGCNIYIAQILSTIMGITFNYFTYTRHVFHDTRPYISRYMGAYALNYLLGVGFLTLFHHFLNSPYLAGFLSLVTTSIVNYVILKFFVFTREKAQP